MPNTKTRVVGSGFTTFNYRGKPIAFLERVTDSGQAVLGGQGGWEPIYVIGSRHAEEIVTSRVLGVGTLTVQIKELWNEQIWEQLEGLRGAQDLASVYDRLAQEPSLVTCQKIIKPPGSQVWRGKIYHNCVPAAIGDGEVIEIGSLSVSKQLSIIYTHTTPIS